MSSGSDPMPQADIESPVTKFDRPAAHGFEELVDGVPETFVFYDQTGRITFANDEFRRRTGRSMSELLGKRPFEWDDGSFADRSDVARFRQHLDATLATGEPSELTRVHTMPSGKTEVYRVSFRAQRDQAGRVVGAFMFAQDISDLALARKDAAHREHEFRMLAENLPDILVRYDGEGRVTYVNDELEARTQRSPRSMLGRRPFEGDRSDVIGAETYERCLDEVLTTGESRQVELTRVLPSGDHRVHSVIMRAERNPEGEITGAFSIGRDVSDLVRARHEIAAREHEYRTLTENLPDLVLRYDLEGRATYISSQFGSDVKTRIEDVLGKRPTESPLPPGMSGIEEYERCLMHVIATGEPAQAEIKLLDARGEQRVHSVLVRAERDADQTIRGALAIGRDVTDLVRARQEIAAREFEFRSLAENLPEIVIRYDREGRALYVNHRVTNSEGLDDGHIVGKRPTEGAPAGLVGVDEFERRLGHTLATGQPAETELLVPDPSGDMRVHSVLIRAERDDAGTLVGALAIGRDVTELVRARQRANDNERQFRSLAENATDFIGRWDTEARRIYVNPALARLMGGAPHELIGGSSTGGPTGEFADLSAAIRTCLREPAPATVLQRYCDPSDGDVRVHEVRLVPEFDDDGTVVSVLGIGRDISEVIRQREALEHAARTDSLTGVASRQVLYEQLPGALAAATRAHRRVALLLVDLDGFKHVNDQHGHRLGDRILRAVGHELSSCLAPDDFIVRLGGDEFVLVLTDVESPTDASVMAHQARLRLSCLDPGSDERFPKIDASVGIAMFPDDGTEVDTLLAHADLALYDAKRAGRGRVEFFRPELRAAMERRSTIEQALHDCVPDVEMALYLQPICTLGSDPHVWGAEALLRWNHPRLGPIGPDEFIPIAEQNGQIVPIGRWVLRRAAELAVERNQNRSRPLRIAVNVSTRQFTLDDIGDAVRDALALTGCDPRWMIIELTESLLLEDLPLVDRSLEALRSLGVAIAIDDFGTGYSSLHYLTRLRIDHMKVDKAFVRDADVDRQQLEVVRALVAMAHALGIDIVAEGIETPGQAELLRKLGCRLGQGYLLAPPLPVDQFDIWLTTAAISLREALPA